MHEAALALLKPQAPDAIPLGQCSQRCRGMAERLDSKACLSTIILCSASSAQGAFPSSCCGSEQLKVPFIFAVDVFDVKKKDNQGNKSKSQS